MVVLITGANGFVGRHLVNKLRSKYDIIPTGRNAVDKVIELNLCDDASIASFLTTYSDKRIDVIVHAAGRLANSSMTPDEQMSVFDENVKITKNVIKLVRGLNAQVLINFSSIAVYPNEDGEYKEDSVIRTSNNSEALYGLSKFVSENLFDYSIKKDSRIVHLRLSQIYGNGIREDRIISVMKKSIYDSNIIEVYGNGERVSNFINVEEVCRVIDEVICWDDARGVYNIGGENLSYLELAKCIRERYGNKDTKILLREKGSKAKFILNTDKFAKLRRRHGSVY